MLFRNAYVCPTCSPTRSCILTGRNHHSNAMACITEGSTGFPGYNANIPFENGFLSEILLQNGYNTYAIESLGAAGEACQYVMFVHADGVSAEYLVRLG